MLIKLLQNIDYIKIIIQFESNYQAFVRSQSSILEFQSRGRLFVINNIIFVSKQQLMDNNQGNSGGAAGIGGNRSQDHPNAERHNRNTQSHFQSTAQGNQAIYYQQQRNQQSPPSHGQNQMQAAQQQTQRTTRIFLPHQTTVKNQHQRQSSNGGQPKGSAGVTFQKNRRAAAEIQRAGGRDGSYDLMARSAQEPNGRGGVHSRHLQQQQVVDFYPREAAMGKGGGQGDYSDEEADEANVTGSILMAQRSQKQNMEDYAFSPRDGQANVRHQILQPNFKKRTPSGANKIQQAQAAINQQIEIERKKIERVRTTKGELGMSMSPPNYRQSKNDLNAEDFVVENEEAEAEMSSINQNVKKSISSTQQPKDAAQFYPKMFQGHHGKITQQKLNQLNQNRGDQLQQEIGAAAGDDKLNSPFFRNYKNLPDRSQMQLQQEDNDSFAKAVDSPNDNFSQNNRQIHTTNSAGEPRETPNYHGSDQQQQQHQRRQTGKLSGSKHGERSLNQVSKRSNLNSTSKHPQQYQTAAGVTTSNQQSSGMAAAQKDSSGKFHLNLHGVHQEKQSKMRKILSMRDPVTISQERQQYQQQKQFRESGVEDEHDSENVLDNQAGFEDLDASNKLEIERNRLDALKQKQQQRSVHSPSDKFARMQAQHANVESQQSAGRVAKNTLRSSWKSQNKSKSSNTGASGSQSARGPNTQIRGLSQSRVPITFQNQIQNQQQIVQQQLQQQQNMHQANTGMGAPVASNHSRKTFNQTQKLTLKASSSANLGGSTTKRQITQNQKMQLNQAQDDDSDGAEYNFIDQIEMRKQSQFDDHYHHHPEEAMSPGKLDSQGLMEMPKTNQLMSQRNRISNISTKAHHAQPQSHNQQHSGQHHLENELMTPSTLMPQLMKISPSKRKNNSNNQVVMMMQNVPSQGPGGGPGSFNPNQQVSEDRMRRKGRGQQEQGNPKQTSEKQQQMQYNLYNNPIQQVQASQVCMEDTMEPMEQDEDLGQEFFSSPYAQYPNQQQMPRKSSVRLTSNPDEERQEIKNQNMHNMFPSNTNDVSSKFQHYNRLPSKSAQLSFGKKLNFQKRPVRIDRRKNARMPYSIFEQFKPAAGSQDSTSSDFKNSQKQTATPPNELTQTDRTADPGYPNTKQFLFSDNRIDKLYDEIYNDESSPFFAFFSSSDKNKKDVRKLETYYATIDGVGRDAWEPRMSPNAASDSEFNSNFKSLRDAHSQSKEENQRSKLKSKKTTKQDQQFQNDPLAQLWQELQDQDEELIYSDSCRLQNDSNSFQRSAIASMSSLYVSGIESSRVNMQDSSMKITKDHTFSHSNSNKPTIIPYDYHAEIHNDANEFAANVSNDEKIIYYFVCYQKMQCLREFMKAKSRHQKALEDWTKYSLKNSIIPAIQGHVMILIEVSNHFKEDILTTALSPRTILSNYQQACDKVSNWLQTCDFGPLEQIPELDPISQEREEVVGACVSPSVSTKEFYDIKLYQVDEELPDLINPMFNPMNTMYYVDKMGNLLKSIKQAFYEKPEDKSYMSKLFSSDNQTSARENLCKAYDVVREIYESILHSSRQKQLKYVSRLYLQDVKDAKLVCNRIKDGFSVEDLSSLSHLNLDMHADKSPTGLTFFNWHAHSILEISFFSMTTHQYTKVLMGLPEYDKVMGDNTQVLLKAKIDILKKSLQKSSGDHEVQLVQYIQYLKSVKYNCNVFGKFNPITINEEEVIEQMAKRR